MAGSRILNNPELGQGKLFAHAGEIPYLFLYTVSDTETKHRKQARGGEKSP